MPAKLKKEIAQQHEEYKIKLMKLYHNSDENIMFVQVKQLIRMLEDMRVLAQSTSKWEQWSDKFQKEVKKIDERRGENFVDTFPELARLYK